MGNSVCLSCILTEELSILLFYDHFSYLRQSMLILQSIVCHSISDDISIHNLGPSK